MTLALQGRVCIITGAGRGIGAEFAVRMAQAGARIIAADRDPSTETVRRVRADGGVIEEVQGDVATAAGAQGIADAAIRVFGGIDVLLNNAALYGGIRLRSFEEIPEDEWDAVMSVNVKGIWQMCRAVVPHMRARGYGRIVNVSSNVVFMGKSQFLHYVASKGAVWAMTNALSREVAGTGITVNGIAPGYTITAATRSMAGPEEIARLEASILDSQSVKRLIEPGDLAGAAIFLASEASALVTGQTLTVDGGTITR